MYKYREYIGWVCIILAAIRFLQLPLPPLPPMLSSFMFALVPGIGEVLFSLVPMLLFAAGIGLVKGWNGGRQLFCVFATVMILTALAGLEYNPVASIIDLVVLAVGLTIILWGDWRQLLPAKPRR